MGGNTARGTIDGGGGTKTQGEVGFVAQQGGIIEGKVAAQAQQPTEAASPAGAATVPPAAATREQQVAMRKAAKVKEIAAKLKQRAAKQAADAAAKKQADAARVTGSTEASRAHAASAQKIQQGTAANHEQTFLPSGETVRPTGVDGAQQNVNLGGQGGGTRKKRKRKKKKKRNKTAKKKRKK